MERRDAAEKLAHRIRMCLSEIPDLEIERVLVRVGHTDLETPVIVVVCRDLTGSECVRHASSVESSFFLCDEDDNTLPLQLRVSGPK